MACSTRLQSFNNVQKHGFDNNNSTRPKQASTENNEPISVDKHVVGGHNTCMLTRAQVNQDTGVRRGRFFCRTSIQPNSG